MFTESYTPPVFHGARCKIRQCYKIAFWQWIINAKVIVIKLQTFYRYIKSEVGKLNVIGSCINTYGHALLGFCFFETYITGYKCQKVGGHMRSGSKDCRL